MHGRQEAEAAPTARRIPEPASPRSPARSALAPSAANGLTVARVLQLQGTVGNAAVARLLAPATRPVIQRVVYQSMRDMWADVAPEVTVEEIAEIVNADPSLAAVYEDAETHLPLCDFVPGGQRVAECTPTPTQAQPYRIDWNLNEERDPHRRVSLMIHELMHAAVGQQYDRGGQNAGIDIWKNMHLPSGSGAAASEDRQATALRENWTRLDGEVTADAQDGLLAGAAFDWVTYRVLYAFSAGGPEVHYETVLADILYYLRSKRLVANRTYAYASLLLAEANARRRQPRYAGPQSEVPVLQPPPFAPAAAQAGDDPGCCVVM